MAACGIPAEAFEAVVGGEKFFNSSKNEDSNS